MTTQPRVLPLVFWLGTRPSVMRKGLTMCPTLETLDLTSEQRAAAREAVGRLAYQNWLDAGQPCGADVDCWLKAEQQWIAQNYVPPRPLDGERPAPGAKHPRKQKVRPPVTETL